jgi:hypothetical protein
VNHYLNRNYFCNKRQKFPSLKADGKRKAKGKAAFEAYMDRLEKEKSLELGSEFKGSGVPAVYGWRLFESFLVQLFLCLRVLVAELLLLFEICFF